MVIFGTSSFVSVEAAEKYFKAYGYDNVKDTVQRKIKEEEIHIGPPDVQPGKTAHKVFVNEEGRYMVQWTE